MSKVVRRGFVSQDKKEFGEEAAIKLQQAAQEIFYLINRGYAIKAASTFVGNHYLLSERQRLALARMLSTTEAIEARQKKQILDIADREVIYIDGFNCIITLEVALSDSLILRGMDGTIRDLAGLRGTYRIIDKTEGAVHLILEELCKNHVKKAIIYLDAPVSNSGRLKTFLLEKAINYPIELEVQVIYEVDKMLESKEAVISSDAIILDKCISWYNLASDILKHALPEKKAFVLL